MPQPITLTEMNESADWVGYRENRLSRINTPDHLARLDVFNALMENRDQLPTHRWLYQLQEAMTTSDFPYLFGDSVARELLSHYKAVQPKMMQILRKRAPVADFRSIKTFRKSGYVTMRLQQVQEKGEYLAAEYEEDQTEYKLRKWGRQLDFSWEAFLNDDLGLFSQCAQDLAMAVRNTIEWFVTTLYWNAAGPIAANFGNAAASTAPLTIGALETAYEAMIAYRHPDTNEPVMNAPKYLVVPPALKFTAEQILHSVQKMWLYPESDEGGPFAYPTTNVISQQGLQLIVNEWQPFVDTTTPTTAWALFSDPAQIAAGEIAFMKGHENPEIVMKKSDKVGLAGMGDLSSFTGDFATDNIFYRVRHVFYGAAVETRACWASTGTG
ncbi:MAG: hypothetical protein JRG73_16435 [Deltaproteobacteria bacterium]|nr:hypothetical protein [Deltaproteobacteria bacterium]